MTQLIAHRGYSARYPENTFLAFRKAVENGADGIELDVHLTADNVLFICHDETIDRTSNGSGYIKDKTFLELSQYSYHYDKDVKDKHLLEVRAMSLEEFLAWYSPLDLMVNIELKTDMFDYEGIEDMTIELIKRYQMEDRVIISSFNHETIKRVKKIDASIQCGYLVNRSVSNPGRYCQQEGVEFYHPHYSKVDQDLVNSCQRHEIGINAWTINEPEAISEYLSLNQAAIITDEVELVMNLRESLRSS